jgi:glycosyltransferase involved in cell wall biosynthesis
MRIAQIAPLYESVPPRLYGGTERVVSWLTEELVRRGHAVTLFATGDSRSSAELVAAHPRALRADTLSTDPLAAHVVELARVLERAGDFDVIHSHIDYPAFLVAGLIPTPVLHTLHGRLDLPFLRAVFARFPAVPLVSISDSQRQPLASLALNWIATVHHGLPVDTIPYGATGDGAYLAFLGRLSPEKRPDLAVAVARRLGLPLRIAAKLDVHDRPYFERELATLFDDPLVEFLGEIGDAEKWALLRGALCLLFPIDWPEPFGLAMIEALACGTPVVARPCGAVPEILVDGQTGFLADSVEELAEAVKRVDLLDRARCRRWVEERFSVTAMADAYEAAYRRLLG